MGVIKEFREFAVKGNVMDMAVGIIIGGAFGKIVSSLVNDLLMPPIGMLMKGVDFSEIVITLKEATTDEAGAAVPAVTMNVGTFLNTTIDFVIVAFAVFLLVKSLNTMRRRMEKEKEAAPPPPPPGPSNEEKLLAEIRDLLRKA